MITASQARYNFNDFLLIKGIDDKVHKFLEKVYIQIEKTSNGFSSCSLSLDEIINIRFGVDFILNQLRINGFSVEVNEFSQKLFNDNHSYTPVTHYYMTICW